MENATRKSCDKNGGWIYYSTDREGCQGEKRESASVRRRSLLMSLYFTYLQRISSRLTDPRDPSPNSYPISL